MAADGEVSGQAARPPPAMAAVSQQLDRLRADGLDEKVTFLGDVDDVGTYLRRADLFLLTSREEPFGRVMLEAAFAELPVICFAGSGGAPEFVEEDAGIIVEWADPIAMADATLRLIRDKSLRMQLGRQASAKARLHFSTDRVFPRLLSTMRRSQTSRRRYRSSCRTTTMPAIS